LEFIRADLEQQTIELAFTASDAFQAPAVADVRAIACRLVTGAVRQSALVRPRRIWRGEPGMRKLLLGAIACVWISAALYAQAPDPQLTAPINAFLDAFNKGDMPGAAATHATGADLVIVDEVAPYLWRGAQAFTAWAADLDADAKKKGITDPKVTLGAVTRVEMNGGDAYVVVPAVYTFKEKGVAMRESAQMTFALKKGSTGWLIHGWTWTGPKPSAATGAASR
jgi:hypothetical protein